MQIIIDLWKTTIGKLAIIGGGGITGLLSLCVVCVVCGALVKSDDKTVQTTPLPSETPAAVSSPTEAIARLQPVKVSPEPLPAETPTLPAPTAIPIPTKVVDIPTETPNVVPVEPIVIAGENDINLRRGPGTDYEVVGTLGAGDSLNIVGRNNDSSWWQVSTPDDVAWVSAGVVKVNNAGDAIPVIEAPPVPIQPTATAIPQPATAVPTEPAQAPASAAIPAEPVFSSKGVDPPWWPCAQNQVKGNMDSMIYHPPGGTYYARTYEGVECFNTRAEAEAKGYRAPKR